VEAKTVADQGHSSIEPQSPRPVTIVAHEVGTPGGMERQLGELVTGLLARGHRVTVVARRCALPPHVHLRWARVPGPARPFTLAYPWFFLIGSLLTWRRREGLLHTTGAVVLNRADVSTVHFCHRAFQLKTSLLRARRPGILHALNARVAARMSLLAERYCYRLPRTRRLVAVSDGVAREIRTFFPAMAESVSVIPNGVDHGAFSPNGAARSRVRSELRLGANDLVALFIGGEWERKGLRYAIEAVGKAPAWRLVVVGDGDTGRFRRLAIEAGARERVQFTGDTSRTEPYYAAADAFVLPTAYETFSLVTLEAAAAGLPLLVAPVSGVEDILADGRNGWFVERDSDVIAKRLHQLQSDECVRRDMGHAARATSQRYGWAPVVEAYARLYGELDSSGPRE
jgi:glycosyltransferase involved in cell wall biosynthesis